ncbi:MAG: PQQ-binding-like beta-propeller repeat protein, partial [Acidimicrobiia bacterium]
IGAVVTHPVISGGVVFVGVEQGGIHAYAAGSCGTPADGYSAFYPSSRAVREGLTVVPDTLYLLEDRLVIAMSLDGALWVDAAGTTPSPWNAPFAAESLITTAPVLAEDVLYLGTQDGIVHAIDAVDGAPLWQFNAGAAVRGETIVAPGAVFVTTADGEIIAIAQEQAQ